MKMIVRFFRKKVFLYLLSGLFLITLAGCSKSDDPAQAPEPAEAGTFIKTVSLPDSPASAAWIFNSDPGANRVMILYRAGDVQGSGMINSISFRYADALASAVTCPNVTIRMGHTSVTDLALPYDNNVNQGKGSFQTLANGVSVTIPAGSSGGYFTIPLTQPFNYNGVDNLVVDVSRSSACTGTPTYVSNTVHQASPAYNSVISSGGGLGPSVPDIRFNFAGGDNVAVGLFGNLSNVMPFGNALGQRKVQLLYTAAEVNGSGGITGIAFPAGLATTAEEYTVNVRLGHTNLTQLTSTFANNFNVGTPVTVASGAKFSVPAGIPVNSYIWIPMPIAAFNYDGTHNLIVEIEVTAKATGGMTDWKLNSNAPIGRKLYGAAGASTGDGIDESVYYCIKFRFNGGTMDVVLAGPGTWSFPFSGASNNKSQHLYLASELGTKGTIAKVARRLATSDAVASDYASFTVVMGHTANKTLGATFSANLSGAQTVYSGTFTMPAGLKVGDWIEIPLSTPFVYDGERNLVVQTSTLSGAATNYIGDHKDDVRYLMREAAANNNTTDAAGANNNWLADLRLIMQ